jgi:hypothetical protein
MITQILQFLLLFCFVVVFSSIYTLIAYKLTDDHWMSTFITAEMAIILLLENMELNKIIQEKECEIVILKRTAHLTLTPKLTELQYEIQQLKDHVTDNALDHNDRRRQLRRTWS